MSITYDLIIKYLAPLIAKPQPLLFTTPKNESTYCDKFPPLFQNLLLAKVYRYGVTQTNSFWSSLLTLLKKDFLTPYQETEVNQIDEFKTTLLSHYPAKYPMEKSEIREILKPSTQQNSMTLGTTLGTTLQYIVDVLDINILIFDFKTEKISTAYKGNLMNPFKSIIMLACHEMSWEPLILKSPNLQIKHFSYNDEMIINILKQPITYHDARHEVLINNNINAIIIDEIKSTQPKPHPQPKPQPIKVEVKDSNPIFITQEPQETKQTLLPILTKNKMLRMTKDCLIEIAKSSNLDTTLYGKLTKLQIVDKISEAKK